MKSPDNGDIFDHLITSVALKFDEILIIEVIIRVQRKAVVDGVVSRYVS